MRDDVLHREHHDGVAARLLHRRHRRIELGRAARFEIHGRHSERRRRGFEGAALRLVAGVLRRRQDGNALQAGIASFIISMRLPTSSSVRNVMPVMLPPGRARLWTKPASTGSPLKPNTTGIVGFALNTAFIATPCTTMTSGLERSPSSR
jgi:hypothetical protein